MAAKTESKQAEKSYKDILSKNGSGRVVKHEYLHIGFTLSGDDAKTMRDVLTKAGITNVASYVRDVVLSDLEQRLVAK